MKTPMSTETKLSKDEEGESVDNTKYRGMICSLLYLTASRPDIMFSVCLCARFQEDPKTSHLEAVKRIFRYVKGTMHLGLWYPKGSGIETIVYADSDHAGDYVDQKITSGICTFMGCCLTSWFSKKQTAPTISTTEAKYTPPKRTSTSEASAMTHAAIRKLVVDRVAITLEAQAAMMEIINNPNKNSRPRRTLVVRKCTHENFLSCQPFYFNGTEGDVGLIHWFERTKSIFSHSNYAKKNKVKFAINTLIEESLFWWNSIAQPIGVEEAYKISWSEFKRLLIKKYCPQIEIKKMEETITITQKLIEQVMKHNSVQETNNQKQKLEDRRNTTNGNNNNYHNNNNSNDHHH
ncbi:hypothetical protein Tco_0717644 [Tanacetum coccineum]